MVRCRIVFLEGDGARHVRNFAGRGEPAVALGWVVGWLTGWGVAALIEDWLKRTEKRRQRADGILGEKDEDKS